MGTAMTDRATAVVVGTLFLVASIAGLIGLPLQESVVGGDDYLTAASAHPDRLATGVLLQLVMGVAVVSIAVVIYPVLRRGTERLAMGYVVARALEAMVYIVSATGLLALITVSEKYVAADAGPAGGAAGTAGDRLGSVADRQGLRLPSTLPGPPSCWRPARALASSAGVTRTLPDAGAPDFARSWVCNPAGGRVGAAVTPADESSGRRGNGRRRGERCGRPRPANAPCPAWTPPGIVRGSRARRPSPSSPRGCRAR